MDQTAKKQHHQKGATLSSQMTVHQLTSQLLHKAKGIEKLGILPYNWWNESLHGVARAGTATVFPQAIAMAATFSEDILFHTAEIISTEARAKFNESQQAGDYGIYKGLTMWSPNINIYRDPRWGRGQETYGEDPCLTSALGVAFIKGLQGNHPDYVKTAACAKHFVVHSGPEAERHSFNAVVSKKDLVETYLPAFKKAVMDAQVCGVMGAYNRTNGEACCASPVLIQQLLRDKWGFDGYFVSDCGALCDIVRKHKLERNPVKGAAMALNAGCDLECGKLYRMLPFAYAMGYVKKATLQKSAARLMEIRSRLGMFDNNCPYNNISPNDNAAPEHEAYAITVAEKGIVLLENNGILPLKENKQRILITGYNAENDLAYLGNYFGEPTKFKKVTEAVKAKNAKTQYAKGTSLYPKEEESLRQEALEKAKDADLLIVCTGLDCSFEGEEAGELLQGGGGVLGKQGDRLTLALPQSQQVLLEALLKLEKKIIILNFSGGCVDLQPYKNRVDAILQCWYPGAMAGEAIANLLFGKVTPSGKLPVTFYRDVKDLPDFTDYAMENRTYRYFKGSVQYPFGYGLSYTSFALIAFSKSGNILSCQVQNTGAYPSDEVLQLYVSYPDVSYQNPVRTLIQTTRFHLSPNEIKTVQFEMKKEDLYSVNENGDTVFLNGSYQITVTDGQSIAAEPILYVNQNKTALIEKCPI